MEYTVEKLARLAGISGRTLRHYDQIGLLKPGRISSSGYRIYGAGEVDRLQQILFYREMGMPLEEIKHTLEQPGFNARQALLQHRRRLVMEKERVGRMIGVIDQTLLTMEGEDQMSDQEKFEAFKKKALSENEQKYGTELRSSYGDATLEAANEKFAGLSQLEYREMTELGESILAQLKEALAKGLSAQGDAGTAVAAAHKKWLGYTWPAYSTQAHRGLADMYLADERFTRYYDEAAGPGAAAFLRDAIHHYTENPAG